MPPRIREIMQRLERDGWVIQRFGKHVIYVHRDAPGTNIAVPNHPASEISPGVYREIRKKAGWS
jgi:predicted RNA binding protein YcfA (HicA-like mRNA interferase family)